MIDFEEWPRTGAEEPRVAVSGNGCFGWDRRGNGAVAGRARRSGYRRGAGFEQGRAATEPVRKDAAANGGSLELVELDLANLNRVRACAEGFSAKGQPFDVVIANTGVMATPFGQTVHGFETQFGTNRQLPELLRNQILNYRMRFSSQPEKYLRELGDKI
jgi:hypothetical protein